MTHDEAVKYLTSFSFWCRFQTEGLIDLRSVFVAVQSLMCDIDFLGALYGEFDGGDTAKRENRSRFVRLFREVVARATNNHAYGKYAPHLYDSFRVGSVHPSTPRRLTNPKSRTPILTWSLLPSRHGVAVRTRMMMGDQYSWPTCRQFDRIHRPLSCPSVFLVYLRTSAQHANSSRGC